MVRRYVVGKSSTDIEPGDSYALIFWHDTELAWGVTEGDATSFEAKIIWLPKSACSLESVKSRRGEVVEIWVPDWLAEQKGLV